MKYRKLTGVILKKQNYKEADQIITLWTRDAGKVRVLARAVRKQTSKLNYNLQDLSLVKAEITGKNTFLPVLTSVETENNHKYLRQDLGKTAAALVACELMLKMTADEQPNQRAFKFLTEYLNYLDEKQTELDRYNLGLQSFTLKLLSALGFGHAQSEEGDQDLFKYLELAQYKETEHIKLDFDARRRIHEQIGQLVESVLERSLKSQVFLLKL